MDKTIFYMPVFLKEQALNSGDALLLEFSEFFKLVAPNTCVIDRTSNDALNTPFKIKALSALPKRGDFDDVPFGELCMRRAREIADEGKPIKIFYSGGLDSTVVVLSFLKMIESKAIDESQLEIFTSPYAIAENPKMWELILKSGIKLSSVNDGLQLMGATDDVSLNNRFVMGENADQLFGSDIILTDFSMFEKQLSEDTLAEYCKARGVDRYFDATLARLSALAKASPVELKTMADFIWWMNISIKWQSVALRALCFSNFLQSVKMESDLKRFETFFNTQHFQHQSLFGTMNKWGDSPSHTTYKYDARVFISTEPALRDYSEKKIKVPSLYRVLSANSYSYNVLKVRNDGHIYSSERV
jgi:hypothetical protein